jgi:predicted RNA-binding Zn-ribbon protein involved in translation (DUF1610 family)
MQTFICPECGHESTYDPWVESAHCDQCGYKPPPGLRLSAKQARRRTDTHQSFLDELVAHWSGAHAPDPAFMLRTSERAFAFFQDYQQALGEDPHLRAGGHMRYIRNYHPQQREALSFVGAYLLLRRGERTRAAQHLRALTLDSPDFADPWIWLSATTDDPAERIDYLENAVLKEPAHPLALDALALAQGKISPASEGRGRGEGSGQAITTAVCPQCSGSLHYEPGATEVACPYCGHQVDLERVNLLEAEARLVGDLQLQRRYRGHTWAEVQRVVRCQSCGAELVMTRHLAKQCAFCGSTSILTEDNQRTFEQPDGFLPFEIDEQRAMDAVDKARRASLQRLRTWLAGGEQRPVEFLPVYLPFWVFDGFVEVRVWATDGSVPRTFLGDAVPDANVMMFDNLLFSAVHVPGSAFLKRIFPFELGALVPYGPRLLADWPAALYHRDVEVVFKDADDAMIALARQRAGILLTQKSSSVSRSRVGRSFQVNSATYQLVLLPVWVALMQGADRRSLALVNGQTGKVAFGPTVSRSRTRK